MRWRGCAILGRNHEGLTCHTPIGTGFEGDTHAEMPIGSLLASAGIHDDQENGRRRSLWAKGWCSHSVGRLGGGGS
jgi:hypothetical protein